MTHPSIPVPRPTFSASVRFALNACLLVVSFGSPLPCQAAEAITKAKTPVAAAIAEPAKPVSRSVSVASVSVTGDDAPPPAADSSMIEEMAKLGAQFAKTNDEPIETFTYECKYVRAQSLKRGVEGFLSSAGAVTASDESDMIVVVDRRSILPVLRQVVEAFDRQVPQVLVSARVVEFTINDGFQKQFNVEFQKFRNTQAIPKTGSSATGTDNSAFVKRLTDSFVQPGSDPTNLRGTASYMSYDPNDQSLLSLFIQFMQSQGQAEVLSAPNLIMRRGVEGNIITGQDVPIQSITQTSGGSTTATTFRSVGIKLRVTPVMITDNRIRLQVVPEVSNVQEYTSTGAPLIAVRSATTELEMKDGQLVSIGGLLRKEIRKTQKRVPILASIPYLGWLFRSNSESSIESQLVIFLRVQIMNLDQMNGASIRPDNISKEVTEEIDRLKENLKQPKPTLDSDLKKLTE